MNKRKQIYRFAEFNIFYFTKLIIISLVWYLCWLSYEKIKNVEMLKGFVPHEILQIEADAPISKIKKAFRRLSRLKHPDKNKNNPLAVSEFIEITKAYYVSSFQFNNYDLILDNDRPNRTIKFRKIRKSRGVGPLSSKHSSPKSCARKRFANNSSCHIFHYCFYIDSGLFLLVLLKRRKRCRRSRFKKQKTFQ